jgi:hypothetical protein
MAGKKGKKKAMKKLISNAMEDKIAEGLAAKMGLQTTDSEYGSEMHPTPREGSGADESFADHSF